MQWTRRVGVAQLEASLEPVGNFVLRSLRVETLYSVSCLHPAMEWKTARTAEFGAEHHARAEAGCSCCGLQLCQHRQAEEKILHHGERLATVRWQCLALGCWGQCRIYSPQGWWGHQELQLVCLAPQTKSLFVERVLAWVAALVQVLEQFVRQTRSCLRPCQQEKGAQSLRRVLGAAFAFGFCVEWFLHAPLS